MRLLGVVTLALLAAAAPTAAAQGQDRQAECLQTRSDLSNLIDCLSRTGQARPFDDDSGLACARFETERLTRPVAGKRVLGFDQSTQYGSRSKGVVIETSGGSSVVAPSAALVIYAGEFRSYGLLVIMEPGCGLTFLLAGMTRANVVHGQLVAQGETVGVMQAAKPPDSPVLYVELRRNQRPVDPGPDIAGE